MPRNGIVSSLWNHAKLYKRDLGSYLESTNRCFVCEGRASAKSGLCSGCRGDLPSRPPRLARRIEFVDDALAAFRYEFPITEIVHAAKFHGDLNALEVLASGFTDEFLAHLGEVDLLLPVPLLPWRFLRRGFNQAGELARRVNVKSGIDVRYDIAERRQLWGLAQSRLNAPARRANVAAAFGIRGGVNLAGLRIAIVDDVVTTGATCSALAGALRTCGAERVIVVAAAATPRHHD